MNEVMYATSERNVECYEIAEALLHAGATSSTRLHVASLKGSVETVIAELIHTDANVKDSRGIVICLSSSLSDCRKCC